MVPVASCANHADREAMGICVRCGRLVCSECVTRLDGINHCVACLEEVGQARASAPPQPPSAAGDPGVAPAGRGESGSWVRLAFGTALLALALWGILEATLPGG